MSPTAIKTFISNLAYTCQHINSMVPTNIAWNKNEFDTALHNNTVH